MVRYVVAVDIHEMPAQLIATAADMAKQASAELVLLAVFDPPLMPPPEFHPDKMGMHALATNNLDEAHSVLGKVQRRLQTQAVRATVVVRVGDIVPTVLEVVEELDAVMLIVATHGRQGIGRLLMGSVSEQLIRQSTRPVLVVRTPHVE